jgi:hypothetical protein
MNAVGGLARRDGFILAVLDSPVMHVEVVPALGAKVLSMIDRRSGREWMWSPPGDPPLFANRLGDAFPDSTLRGADECLPTIDACRWQGRELPDHGEAWSVPWTLDEAALAHGALVTRLDLPLTPLTVERRITLDVDRATFSYHVRNRGAGTEDLLWAFHPLLSWQAGDRLELPPGAGPLHVECSTEAAGPQVWDGPQPAPGIDLEALELGHDRAYVKLFAGPLRQGRAAILGGMHDRFAVEWDPAELPWFGLWLTRGGWRGIHHAAPEPTTSGSSCLAHAIREGLGHRSLAAGSQAQWRFSVKLGR